MSEGKIYVVTVNGVPAHAFTEEHEAEHYIDHHDEPNLCAVWEVPLDSTKESPCPI